MTYPGARQRLWIEYCTRKGSSGPEKTDEETRRRLRFRAKGACRPWDSPEAFYYGVPDAKTGPLAEALLRVLNVAKDYERVNWFVYRDIMEAVEGEK